MTLRVMRRVTVAVAALAMLAGCGSPSDKQPSVVGAAGNGKLTVGIRFDQPGVGYKTLNGRYQGFDVDVARYIAKELGVSEENISWKEAAPADREKLITGGQVD